MRMAILRAEEPFSEYMTQERRDWVRPDKTGVEEQVHHGHRVVGGCGSGQLILLNHPNI